jgi:hypothetical protein
MLRPRADDALHEPGAALPKQPLLKAVARRGLPGILEASLTPAAIFLLTRSLAGTRSAMLAVLLWGCVSVAWRKTRGRTPPALVVVALCGLVVRTLVGVVSGSTFAYFVQPVATMVAIAVVFVLSVLVGRPLIARIAHDFCPIAPEVASRPAVLRLFAGLTVLWAGAQLLTAAATIGMLLSLDTTLFVVLKPIVSLSISAAAVTVTIWWALRVAHREELAFTTV